MKVYIAAPFQQRLEVQQKAKELTELGVDVTSRWRFEDNAPDGAIGELKNRDYYLGKLFIDLDDIEVADILLLLTDQVSKTGGKHVEFGYALARRKQLYIVGGVENIFHWHPSVQHVKWEEFKAILKEKIYGKQRSTNTP